MVFSWSAAAQGTVNASRPSHRLTLELDRCAGYAKTASSHEKYSQKESANFAGGKLLPSSPAGRAMKAIEAGLRSLDFAMQQTRRHV